MLTQASVVGVLAIGMTFVIATAGIDLSVGSIVAAAGVFGGILVGDDGDEHPAVHRSARSASRLLLGTRQRDRDRLRAGRAVHRDAGDVLDRARARAAPERQAAREPARPERRLVRRPARRSRCSGSATGRIFGIPVSVYVFLAIAIAGWVVLNRTRYGRYVVAVGGNREAARIAGVPVRRIIFSVYVLSGLLRRRRRRCCSARGSAAPRRSAETSTSSTRSAPS